MVLERADVNYSLKYLSIIPSIFSFDSGFVKQSETEPNVLDHATSLGHTDLSNFPSMQKIVIIVIIPQ